MIFRILSHRRLILYLLFVLANASVLAAQDAHLDSKTAAQIKSAITALESPKFSIREQAAQDLWQIGLPAKQALKEVIQNGSFEARVRASALLQDFYLGVLPTTSRQDRQLINRFRYGSTDIRDKAFREIVVKLPTPFIERLIATEPNPTLRTGFLATVLADRQLIKHYRSLDAIIGLVDRTAAGMDRDWRRDTTTALLLTPQVIAVVDSPELMQGIWDLIVSLQDRELQQRALTQIVAAPSFVLMLKDRQSAQKVLGIIAGVPVRQRAQLLSSLLLNQPAVIFFADSMLLGELLMATEGLSDGDRDGMTRQIASTIDAAYDDTDTQIRSWMDSVADLQQPDRSIFLASLAMLPMPQKLAEHVVTQIIQDTPQEFCGPTLSLLAQCRNQTIDLALHSAEHCQWVLDAMSNLGASDLHRIGSTIAGDAGFANVYLDSGHFGELAKQCTRLDYSNGLPVFRSLFSHFPEDQLAKPELVKQLVAVFAEANDPQCNLGLAFAMLRNAAVARTVIESEQLAVVLDAAFSQADDEGKVRVLFQLFCAPNIDLELFSDDCLEVVVSHVDRDWPPAKLDQLTDFMLSGGMLRKLRKAGRFQTLIDFLSRDGASVGRGVIASEMLGSQPNIAALTETNQLLTIFDVANKNGCVAGSLAFEMCGDHAVLVEFDQAGRLRELMDASMNESVFPTQSNSPVPLFRYDGIARLLAASGRTQEIYRFIEAQADDTTRLTLVKSLIEHQPNTDVLLPKMQFENLWELIQTQAPGDHRLQLKSQLITAAGKNEIVVSADLLSTLYQAIQGSKDRSSQIAAITTLMSASVAAPNSDLHLEKRLHWIDQQTDVDLRARWVVQLLVAVGPAALITRDRADLLTTSSAQGTTSVRMVQALFQDEAAVDALRAANLFDPLLQNYQAERDANRLLFAVLKFPHACQYLDLETQITPWIIAYLAQQNPDERIRVVKEIGAVDHQLRLIIDAGQLPTFIAWARGYESEALQLSSHSALLELWLRPACLDFLLRESRTDELLVSLRQQPDPQIQWEILRKLVTSEQAIICLAQGGQLKELLKLFEQFDEVRYRSSIVEFIFNYRSFSLWAGYSDRETLRLLFKKLRQDQPEYDRLAQQSGASQYGFQNNQSVEILFELLSGCSEPLRSRTYKQFLLNSHHRWKMVDAGRERDLLHAAKQTQSEQDLKEQILFSTTGVVAHRISQRKYDAAEKLLLEHANHENGYSRLAAFWIQRGVLSSRIEALRTTKPNSPMLPFLLKCDGQFDEAADLAIELADIPQAIRILVQGRRWQRAASLEQQQLDKLPPLPNDPISRGKMLARLAVLQHHAGSHDDCQQTCDELIQLANASPHSSHPPHSQRSPHFQIERLCCNALLLTDRIEPAIEIAWRLDRTLALGLWSQRGDYGRALKAVGFTMDDPQGWVAEWIVEDRGDRRKLVSVLEILQVCELLDRNENPSQADAIYERLVDLIPIQEGVSWFGGPSMTPFLTYATSSSRELDRALLKSARLSLLFPRMLARMKPTAYPDTYASSVFHSSYEINEAYGWWEILNPEVYLTNVLGHSPLGHSEASTVPVETRRQRLRTLHDLLSDDGWVTVDGKEIRMLDYIENDVKHHHGSQRPVRQTFAMLSALLRLGEREHVHALFGGHAEIRKRQRNISPEELGRVLYLTEDFADAVDPLWKSWESFPIKLWDRYLSADALKRSGAIQEGQENLQIASLMALQSNDRAHLISLLDSLGAPSLGTAEAKVLYRAAPTDTLHWFDVCRRLSETETNQARIADFIESDLLRYRLPESPLMQRSDAARMHKPHLHRAATAIDAGDFDGAQQHIDTMLSINRVDPQISELLLPRLQMAGRDAQADSLSERLQPTPQQ